MGQHDIMPWQSPHGGHMAVRHYPMNASETFFDGEPVGVDGDGHATESDATPLPADVMGIALGGPGASNTNPRTGAAWAAEDMVPVALIESGSSWITQNWTVAGSAFDDTAPAATDIGETVGLIRISGVWGVDNGPAANDAIGRVEDILNSRKESILETGETLATGDTYYIVFTIVAHQNTPDSAEAAAPVA